MQFINDLAIVVVCDNRYESCAHKQLFLQQPKKQTYTHAFYSHSLTELQL